MDVKPFKEMNESIRYEKVRLPQRTGFARGHVPNQMAVRDAGSPILIVICSVDVQKDKLFVDVKGYGERGVTWQIEFKDIPGNPERFDDPCWNELASYIDTKIFEGDDGKLYRIAMTFVDSGHFTDAVYAFVAGFGSGVYACKGQEWIKNGETFQVFSAQTLSRIGLPLAYHVNTGKLKDRISYSLNNLAWNEHEKQPDWYPNFAEDFRDDYFKMFEAEEKGEVIDKATNKWIKTVWRAKFNAPNHGFDTYVYCLAALEIFADDICRNDLGINWCDWKSFWSYAKTGAFYIKKEGA